MEENKSENLLLQLLIDEVKGLKEVLFSHMKTEEEEKKQQTADIKDIKATFATANAAVKLIKWGATIIGALAVSWAFFKDHFTIGVK